MKWSELGELAERNDFQIAIYGGQRVGDPYQANLYGRHYTWRLMQQSECATKEGAKRALCRAVEKIREAK
jgi:glucuronate isomerase